MNIFRVLKMVYGITNWFNRAMKDGRIELREVAELLIMMAEALGIKTDFYLTNFTNETDREAIVTKKGVSPLDLMLEMSNEDSKITEETDNV